MKIAILHRYPLEEIKPTNASIHYLIEELRKEHTVDVKTFKRFNRFRFKFIKSLAWIFYAPMLVAGRGYDIIFCDCSFPYYAGVVKLVSPKSKVIKRMGDFHLMYYCSGWIYKFFHWFERREWWTIDGLIVVSQAMKDYIWEGGDYDVWARTKVVLDPIDLEDFDIDGDKAWTDYEPKGNWDVMFHGYLNKNKGLDMLLEAARQLPKYKFCIVGAPVPNVKIPNVTFVGWKSYEEMPYYLDCTKIGIAIRSKNQGNEYVYTQPFLQYWACGKPVIVSERKCLKGYPWVFNSVNSLVERIKYLLEIEPYSGGLPRYRYPIESHGARAVAKQITQILQGGNDAV